MSSEEVASTPRRVGLLAGYLTEAELALELDRDPRTLFRYRKLKIGPPYVMVGTVPFYPIEGARTWLEAGGTGAAVRSSQDRRRAQKRTPNAAEAA